MILKICPNYYNIIEFNPLIDDEFSKRIIRLYRDFIFKIDINNEEDVIKVKNLDAAVMKYINDYNFRKEIENGIRTLNVNKNCKDIIKEIINKIISIFRNYKDYATRIIYISRWI